jgi:hypothetical protein
MDEVNQTAISWTLGKVVIEASKAVGAPAPGIRWGRLRVPMHLSELTGLMWAYVVLAAAVLLLLLSALRRRRPRRRKRCSVGLGLALPCLDDERDERDEEAGDKRPVSKFTLWSCRVVNALRGRSRPALRRHTSMPLSASWSASQPPSPRGQRTFAPMDLPATPPRGSASGLGTPRAARPSRPRTSSQTTTPFLAPSSSSGGWNDPPLGMLAPGTSTDDEEWRPAVAERTLSRQSSRVNLSEFGGVAQRSASRTNTPLIG